MKILLLLALLATAAVAAAAETPSLLDLPVDSLEPAVREKIRQCQADVQAGLENRPLPFAQKGRFETNDDGSIKKDAEGKPVIGSFGIGDGRTTFWHGDGYNLTIHRTFWSIQNVSGRLVGVSVSFSSELVGHQRVPPIWPPLSFVKFVADKKEANQVPVPMSGLRPAMAHR